MKTPSILLAAIVALPLFAATGPARADDGEPGRPPAMQGDDHDGPGRGGPEQGGPEHGHGPGFGPGFGPGRPPFFRGIELSDAQEDKVFAILHAEAPYLREQSRAAAKAHEALRALAKADKYDDAKAVALAQAEATAESNIALQHVRTQQKLLAVLTPEQRKQQAEGKPGRPARP
jgi:Spy/CpxP family protein refolding chaperone